MGSKATNGRAVYVGQVRGSEHLTVRMSAEYKAWLERAAEHSRLSVSGYLDLAAVAFARAQGFADPAPKR
jgi:hypothetical protein